MSVLDHFLVSFYCLHLYFGEGHSQDLMAVATLEDLEEVLRFVLKELLCEVVLESK